MSKGQLDIIHEALSEAHGLLSDEIQAVECEELANDYETVFDKLALALKALEELK